MSEGQVYTATRLARGAAAGLAGQEEGGHAMRIIAAERGKPRSFDGGPTLL